MSPQPRVVSGGVLCISFLAPATGSSIAPPGSGGNGHQPTMGANCSDLVVNQWTCGALPSNVCSSTLGQLVCARHCGLCDSSTCMRVVVVVCVVFGVVFSLDGGDNYSCGNGKTTSLCRFLFLLVRPLLLSLPFLKTLVPLRLSIVKGLV